MSVRTKHAASPATRSHRPLDLLAGVVHVAASDRHGPRTAAGRDDRFGPRSPSSVASMAGASPPPYPRSWIHPPAVSGRGAVRGGGAGRCSGKRLLSRFPRIITERLLARPCSRSATVRLALASRNVEGTRKADEAREPRQQVPVDLVPRHRTARPAVPAPCVTRSCGHESGFGRHADEFRRPGLPPRGIRS